MSEKNENYLKYQMILIGAMLSVFVFIGFIFIGGFCIFRKIWRKREFKKFINDEKNQIFTEVGTFMRVQACEFTSFWTPL